MHSQLGAALVLLTGRLSALDLGANITNLTLLRNHNEGAPETRRGGDKFWIKYKGSE